MNDHPFTLIDVQNGMFRMSLHTILTPPCFTFFWGLVQTANTLKPRFKNPFNLTVAQAFAAGGGISRQSVHQKQQQLNEIRIDGCRLITITAGSRTQNLAAKYKINYNLIVSETLDIIELTEQPSNIIDEGMTNTGRTHDEPMSFLRSEEIRQDIKQDETPLPKTDQPVNDTPHGKMSVLYLEL